MDSAADYAERLAGAFQKQARPADAAHYRKQAEIVRVGEPLNRVVAVVNDVRYELNDLREVRSVRRGRRGRDFGYA